MEKKYNFKHIRSFNESYHPVKTYVGNLNKETLAIKAYGFDKSLEGKSLEYFLDKYSSGRNLDEITMSMGFNDSTGSNVLLVGLSVEGQYIYDWVPNGEDGDETNVTEYVENCKPYKGLNDFMENGIGLIKHDSASIYF